jgi:putative membrane protein
MNRTLRCFVGLALASVATASAWGVSHTAMGPSHPLPDASAGRGSLAVIEPALETFSPGSTALIPLAAADAPAIPVSTLDASAPSGGAIVGKAIDEPIDEPVNDRSFVVRASENGRQEEDSARDALFQLQDPQLKRVAEKLARDRGEANRKLSAIAGDHLWPVQPDRRQNFPPAGAASADFDARWLVDMVAAHERSVTLYRVQARHGEDPDLRKYARDTLPIIEAQLAELRRLQK